MTKEVRREPFLIHWSNLNPYYKNVLNCNYPNLLSSSLSPCMQATWFRHKAVTAEKIKTHTRKYQLEFEVTGCLCSRGNVNQIARPRAPQTKQKSTKRWSLKQTLLGSAASRYNSWATIKFAMSSSTAPPHRMILCCRSRSPWSISWASLPANWKQITANYRNNTNHPQSTTDDQSLIFNLLKLNSDKIKLAQSKCITCWKSWVITLWNLSANMGGGPCPPCATTDPPK